MMNSNAYMNVLSEVCTRCFDGHCGGEQFTLTHFVCNLCAQHLIYFDADAMTLQSEFTHHIKLKTIQ